MTARERASPRRSNVESGARHTALAPSRASAQDTSPHIVEGNGVLATCTEGSPDT
ncbi:MAG: hypothetical protein Q8P18_01220 [Pseudomonadota bacterium]|nr:hypothetical protein [Pseudomonadota bacterium]